MVYLVRDVYFSNVLAPSTMWDAWWFMGDPGPGTDRPSIWLEVEL
jgi:hypothetical protein